MVGMATICQFLWNKCRVVSLCSVHSDQNAATKTLMMISVMKIPISAADVTVILIILHSIALASTAILIIFNDHLTR